MTDHLAFGRTIWTLTEHARQRVQQRGIRPWMIQVAMEWGEADFNHGCVGYLLTDRTLLKTPFESCRDRLRGLCVVVSLEMGAIVTVKWIHRLRCRRISRISSIKWQGNRRYKPRASLVAQELASI
jgi:hypothetical protein